MISRTHHSHGHMTPLSVYADVGDRRVNCRSVSPRGRNWAIILTFLSAPVALMALSFVTLFALMA